MASAASNRSADRDREAEKLKPFFLRESFRITSISRLELKLETVRVADMRSLCSA